MPVASLLVASIHSAYAVPSNNAAVLEQVVVTAQKRTENQQDVPLSIQTIPTAKLEQLNVTDFDDYVKYLPNVSFQSGGPSFEHTYMRGVASGGDGNHSGSLPSVGMYLDEQPITTIDGNLNIHIYDIARIEALAGPQGTLYGASSQAGTIRIISNKPDPTAFAAGYDLEMNQVEHGGVGRTIEGFVNLPITSTLAVRLVGWNESKAGYIDNVHGAVTFPTSGITLENSNLVQNNFNAVDTEGGRAAIKLDLTESWTIMPQVMGQVQHTDGSFAYNPAAGDLKVQQYFADTTHDSWVQSALTIEGKISNFDLVYTGAYLTRNTHESSDYVDYSLAYDRAFGSGAYFKDNVGNLIDPAQHIIGTDHYTKTSNELRVNSPRNYPLRFTAGLFLQRQVHEILQDYIVDTGGDALGSVPPNDLSIPGYPGTVWLTNQERVDRDKAAFGEFAYDIANQLTLSAGIRHYSYDNTLYGFYGFNTTWPYGAHEGVATCFTPHTPFHGAPCVDLNGRASDSGNSPKVNLTYKFNQDKMAYFTWSKGFRPGGVNRNGGGSEPPYKPDILTNVEIGWKSMWNGDRLRFNGAVFVEQWNDFQFAYLGPNALTIIANAGRAQIKGLESDFEFALTERLTLYGGFAWLNAKLTQAYCSDPTTCHLPGNMPEAPDGQQLPITPKFKGDLTARYIFPLGFYEASVQGSVVSVGRRWAGLRTLDRNELGQEPFYTVADFSFGLEKKSLHGTLYISNAFNKRAVLNRYTECNPDLCNSIAVYDVPNQPRTIGVKFGQKF
jgi:iron complex outermembrane recepter protein